MKLMIVSLAALFLSVAAYAGQSDDTVVISNAQLESFIANYQAGEQPQCTNGCFASNPQVQQLCTMATTAQVCAQLSQVGCTWSCK